MRCSIMIEPGDGQPYAVVRDLARQAERLGFAGVYCSDHYVPAFEWLGQGSPDSWALLAALATDTEVIALGTMVTPVTLRRVTTLAKIVTTVAGIADARQPALRRATAAESRVHLGLGAGWLAAEHEYYGLPLGDPAERFDRLEEHLEALRNLWDPDVPRTTLDGDHVTLSAAPFEPKPSPRPRIILGGRGRGRMPRLAARYADELNVPFLPVDELPVHRRLLVQACRDVGRDPADVAFSAKRGVLVGRTTAELRERAARLMRLAGDERPVDEYLAWLSRRWIIATGSQIAEQVDALERAGVDHLVLQHLLTDDIDMLDVICDHVDVEAAPSPMGSA